MSQAAKDVLRADDDTVSSLLAGLTLGTGVIGTLGGGMLLDAAISAYVGNRQALHDLIA